MRRLLESQAPAPQRATEAILVLGNRLTNATLLADKRDAILGLRSFAKDFPADVASSSWKSLLDCFNTQGDDTELTRLVLEILLLLLSPPLNGVEDTGEIALMLADQFTQLFSLQMLRDVASVRPERTRDCLLSSPGGIGKLAALLRDRRDMILEEVLSVLLILTQDAPEVQKLVLFEGAAETVLSLCSNEFTQDDSSVLLERCISLLGNLILSSPFNQDLLRELGFLVPAQKLLTSWIKLVIDIDSGDGSGSRHERKSLWGFISILRSFLHLGNLQSRSNQQALWGNEVSVALLNLAFCATAQQSLRQEALLYVSDLIRGNPSLQEQFALISISLSDSKSGIPQDDAVTARTFLVNVVEAILDLLLLRSVETLSLRFAALEVFKAYIFNHDGIRQHFLHRALQGYFSAPGEPENVLTILCQPLLRSSRIDNASVWFSSALMFSLCYEDIDIKGQLTHAADGDGAKGEELVNLLHTVCSVAFQDPTSQRHETTLAGYMTFLSGWLYDEPAAVDVFLRESVYLDHLFVLCEGSYKNSTLINGLTAFLIGIIYEFSYSTSAIPRKDLQLMILRKLGKVKYHQDLINLKRSNTIKAHLMQIAQPGDGPQTLDGSFIDFFLDKFESIDRAIDRDSDIETSRSAIGKHGISHAEVQDLRQRLVDAEAMRDSQTAAVSNLQLELAKARERIDRHETLLRSVEARYATDVTTVHENNAAQRVRERSEFERLLLQQEQTTRSSMLAAENHFKEQLMNSKAQHEQQTKNSNALLEQERAKAKYLSDKFAADRTALETSNADLQARYETQAREREADRKTKEMADAQLKQQQVRWQLEKEEYETRLVRMQTEIDDVLILLSDLEDKRKADKQRLREAGCAVESDDSDAEEEDQ